MRIVGITGGIGAGKSTVSSYIRDKGYEVVDADAISRRMTEKGSPVLAEVAAAFGEDVLLPTGELDRGKVAGIVFADPAKKALLERIITDRVLDEVTDRVAVLRGQPGEDSPTDPELEHQGDLAAQPCRQEMAFLDVPLLFETDAWKLCDEIWFVTADPYTRIARVMEREHCSREAVEARIANQMPEEEKERRSDVVIDNSGGLEELYRQLDASLGLQG